MRGLFVATGVLLLGGLGAGALATGCGSGETGDGTGGAITSSTGTGATGGHGATGGGGAGATGGQGGQGGEACVPGSEELCDGVDNNCDNVTDEGCLCVQGEVQDCYTGDPSLVGVGDCAMGQQTCDIHGVYGACENEVLPSSEVCDGADNDCNHDIDDGLGTVTCGLGMCQQTVAACESGQPVPCIPGTPNPTEGCDGTDDNCNGTVDEGCSCVDNTTQPCYSGAPNTRGIGECQDGLQTCLNGQWGGCAGDVTPTTEVCDTKDNDCNNIVDDGDPGGGAACNTGNLGWCSFGVQHCQAGSVVCVQTHQSEAETCNNVDDDCDGTVDDGNPGGGAVCNTGLFGVCSVGTRTCQGGQLDCVQNVSSSNETCDGLDNDCDGTVDDGNPGGGAACQTGQQGVCAPGTRQCQGGQLLCVQNVSSSNEICDGLDNDCDGALDDGDPGGGTGCSTGLSGVCAPGTTHCVGGAVSCVQNVQSSPEQCDLLDNNCNAQTDEGNPGGGGVCGTGLLGVCNAGTRTCQSGTLNCVQNVQPSSEVCDNLDNNCNGNTDENDPGGGAVCSTGLLGVCSPGVRHCVAGALSCVQNVQASAENCANGLDDDCNGTVNNGCCTNSVVDGTFEAGAPWPAWTQASTCCGTPICSVASCCGGQAWCYPHAGTYWSWFGGSSAVENASVAQNIVIPVGATNLTFYFMAPVCATSGTAYVRLLVDGVQLWQATRTDPACGSSAWVQKSVNVAAYANGGSHSLQFVSYTSGPISNFMIDDVALDYCVP
ncbi:MAG: hypothetical protein HY908_12075 [Myxococcales bacterium]|nr:hypothetical protein [Myxococcales bacterium]